MLPVVLLVLLCVGSSLQQCASGITTAVSNGSCTADYELTNGVCCKIACVDYVSKYSNFNDCAKMAAEGWCTNSVFQDIMAKKCRKTCNKCT